jgi:uncharacterized membrane protein
MNNPEHDYKQSFGMGNPPDKEKAKKALEIALDNRKFEIGLYWQRAAYFWALIAAAFAGYFAVLSAESTHLHDKEYLAYILSCIGLIFTWAWFLVNRGSKFWQENWENHVDMLEDHIVGPLYKTVLHRSGNGSLVERWIVGPRAVSVSRVNQWVSLFTICIWLTLLTHSVQEAHITRVDLWRYVIVGAVTLIFATIMMYGVKTNLGAQKHVVKHRRSQIIGEGK